MINKIRASIALPLLSLLAACSTQPDGQSKKVMAMGVVVAVATKREADSQTVLIRTDSGALVVQDMAPGLEPGDRVFVKRNAANVGARA